MGRPRLTPEERAISEARRREKQREYLKKHRSKPEVKEKNREYLRQWRKDNPEKNAAIQIRYFSGIVNGPTNRDWLNSLSTVELVDWIKNTAAGMSDPELLKWMEEKHETD